MLPGPAAAALGISSDIVIGRNVPPSGFVTAVRGRTPGGARARPSLGRREDRPGHWHAGGVTVTRAGTLTQAETVRKLPLPPPGTVTGSR